MTILERVGRHYAGKQDPNQAFSQAQQFILRDITQSLQSFVVESKGVLERNVLISYISTTEAERRLNRLQEEVDTNLRNLMVGMQQEAIMQNEELLKNSELTLKHINHLKQQHLEIQKGNSDIKKGLGSMESNIQGKFEALDRKVRHMIECAINCEPQHLIVNTNTGVQFCNRELLKEEDNLCKCRWK